MAESNKIIKSVYNWTFLAIIAVAIILVNVISSFVYERIDMTEDQRYSLSPGTIEYLENDENLSNRLLIKIYLDGELPAEINRFKVAIEDKLKEFKQYAGNRIEYEFIDPHNGTKEENNELYQNLYADGKGLLPTYLMYKKDGSQSKLMLWAGAVIEYGGATVNTVQFLPGSKPKTTFQLNMMGEMIQNAINNLEYMLISSIRKATQEKKARIAFLGGHGELSYAETQRARALLSPYYSVADVVIGDSLTALDNVDGLIIARPSKKFANEELFVIDQFLMNGGKLMCFIDKLNFPKDSLMRPPNFQTHTSRVDLGLEKLLFSYGLKVNDNYVVDARCAFKQVPFQDQPAIPWFYHVIATPTSHPIARNLEPVSLEYTSEIQFVDNDPNIVLQQVLTSSTNSTATGLAPIVSLGMPLNYGKNPELVPDPSNETNKKCLAGLAEGKFQSYFKNRINAEYVEKIKQIDKSKTVRNSSIKEGKIFVVGNGRFLANAYDSMPMRDSSGYQYRPNQFNNLQKSVDMTNLNIPHFFGNQEFVQNIMDYMMGETSVLDLRSRQIEIHAINNDKVIKSAGYYKLINIGLPIILVLALAFVINYLRKRKFAI